MKRKFIYSRYETSSFNARLQASASRALIEMGGMKRFIIAAIMAFFAWAGIVSVCAAQDINATASGETVIDGNSVPAPPQPTSENKITAPALNAPAAKKISLDIKGMDIVDVLKVFSQEGNMNIVIGRNVTGRVTIFLKDVDIEDAFNIIILSNDLAYEKTGDIVTVMNSRDYELIYGKKFADKRKVLMVPLKYAKAIALAQALNQVKSSIGSLVVDEATNTLIVVDSPDKLAAIEAMAQSLDKPLETKVFSLNYAKAEDIKGKIQDQISKWVGALQIDARTNKIVITDYPQKINDLEKIINAFDEKSKQVIIDAQIIEITPHDEFQMGVDWDYWIKKNLRTSSVLPMSTANAVAVGTYAAALPVTEQGQYKALVDALRTIGKTKILSSPRIMALNNQEAKILVGSKEAYLTQTTSQPATGVPITASQVNFVDVGVQLFVSPTINNQGFVTLKIRPVVSSAQYTSLVGSNQTTQVPIVSTSEAETAVMVKDGVTIMIAGLKKDKKEKEVKKIPLFGDIPGIGFLFRSTSDKVTKTELVIFLTPHITSGDRPVEYQSLTRDKDIEKIINPAAKK